MSDWKWDSVMGRQEKFGGTEAGEEEEGVRSRLQWTGIYPPLGPIYLT